MKHLKKYNEGIFSKAAELLRYNKKADQLIKKYIKMIYDDYNKNKDLFRVSIIEGSEYTELKYMITSGKQTDVQSGNHDDDSIVIEMSFIENIFKWSSDDTQARLEVEKFKSYKGSLVIVGRNLRTGEILEDESGIKSNDPISYINTPSGDVKKMIKFFKKEFKLKYPSMKKYFGKRSILENDPKLRDKIRQEEIQKERESRDKYEEEREREKELIRKKMELKMREEDIIDFFVEVEDVVDIHISYERSIYIDRTIYTSTFFKSLNDMYITSFSLDSNLNKNKLEFDESDIPLKKDIPYHKLMIGLLDDDYSPNEFKNKIDKVINRLKFGLKVEASSMMIYDDADDTGFMEGPKNKDYIAYECNIELNRVGIINNKSAVYIIYLSEI